MVLQRWQSVYLLLAAIAIAIYSFLPVAMFNADGSVYTLKVLSLTSQTGNAAALTLSNFWGLISFNVLIVLIAIIAIFKFKNLKQQKKLAVVVIVFSAVMLISMGIMAFAIKNTLNSDMQILVANCLPIISIIFTSLAIHGINKDQKVLNSYDHIR
jgi:glucan phosphoethanolaminetransferase (alkaline phosphatase superfamily)